MRSSEFKPNKLVIFDIDDTLVHTQTKVHVVKDGEIIDSLNSHDFTHYKLKDGEDFDFGDFRNAREFFEKSKPIIPMMNQLKRDIATGNKVVMVTARADFDDKELFLDTFRKFGIDMGKVHVYRAGNSKQGTTEERKKAIIGHLLSKDDYTKAIMYDDAKPNLHLFMELKKDYPKTRFYAWHVSLEGEASEYMRENIMSERKKRRRKPRWAAYGPGPFGGYGYAAGYSGDGGASGGDGGVGEASYDGNIGMMEVAKFFKVADEAQKKLFRELLEKGKRGLAWKLIQDVTDTKLQGQEFNEAFQQRTVDKLLALGMQGPYSKRDLVSMSSAWSKTLSGIKSSQIMVQDAGNPRHSAWIAPEGGGQWMVGAEDGYTVKSGPQALKVLQFFLQPTNEEWNDNEIGNRLWKNENIELDEGIIDNIVEFLKPYVEKAQGKLKKLQGAVKQEYMETDLMWEIMKKGNNARPFEIEFANKQFKDVLKGVGLGAWLALPIPGNTLWITLLEKLLNKFDVSIMPDEVKRQIFNSMYENFADGKVKGKSRPGRVKRSGASCSGSVTDLRKRAKNASGEKAKMYHWCANMKSGRNK